MTKKYSVYAILTLTFLIIGELTACKSHQTHTKGWTNLLKGDNLIQWHSFNKKVVDSYWSIKDGILTLHPNGQEKERRPLVTNKVYKNFVLTLKWKISPKGNSGILFDVQEDPKYRWAFVTGPEMQVLDNSIASEGGVKNTQFAGSLYDLIPCDPSTVLPAGQWNKIKIKQDNGYITFWMNGHKVVDTKMGAKKWKQLVTGSKFKKWKTFGAFEKGHIALQDHRSMVSFKDIEIKVL